MIAFFFTMPTSIISPTKASILRSTLNTINVINNDFVSPQTSTHIDPTIELGDTVQWVWANGNLMQHSATAAAGQAENWDSLNHLRIVLAFEEEFGLSLRPEEVVAVRCLSDLERLAQRTA